MLKISTKLVLPIFLVAALSLPVIASRPNTKKLINIGEMQKDTIQHTYNYIDPKTFKRKGKFIYFVQWYFFRYKRLGNVIGGKTHSHADCNDWEVIEDSYQTLYDNGELSEKVVDAQKIAGDDGTIYDKSLSIICK